MTEQISADTTSDVNKALQEQVRQIIQIKRPDTVYLNPVNVLEMANVLEQALIDSHVISSLSGDNNKLTNLIWSSVSVMDKYGTGANARQAVKDFFAEACQ